MRLLAIDPGPVESAWLLYDTREQRPLRWAKGPNHQMLNLALRVGADEMAIEVIASYGMAVGAEVFTTCIWVGRFMQAWSSSWTPRREAMTIFRKNVKLHLCGSTRAKDPNVRQALIDRYGPGKEKAIGKKATPGPLYGMSGDCWAALAVAVTVAEGNSL